MMNAYSVWQQFFEVLAVDSLSLHTSLDDLFTLRIRSHDSVQLIFGIGCVFKIVGGSCSVSS